MPPRSHFVAATSAAQAAANKARLDAIEPDPLGLGFVLTLPCLSPAAAGAWPVANAARYSKVISSGVITKVGLHVGTASGNISVAVYRNSGAGRLARPTGSPVATSGAVACPAAGYAEVPLGATVTVADGDWLALSCDNVTATFMASGGSASALLAGLGWGKNGNHPLVAAPAFVDATDATLFRGPQLIGT